MSTNELQRLRNVYSGRIEANVISRYSLLRPGELFMAQDRERALLRLLRQSGVVDTADLQILEVGCGRAHRLLDWVRWGTPAVNLVGIDLMEALVRQARLNLPAARFAVASVDHLPFRDSSFDVVTQFTVFSSILDGELRGAAAREMWRILRPGGLVLWYDFRYPSPRNRDVRPVGRREISQLFPDAAIHIRSTTLAPPLSRSLAPLSINVCNLISLLPALRTHYAALLQKPAR